MTFDSSLFVSILYQSRLSFWLASQSPTTTTSACIHPLSIEAIVLAGRRAHGVAWASGVSILYQSRLSFWQGMNNKFGGLMESIHPLSIEAIVLAHIDKECF